MALKDRPKTPGAGLLDSAATEAPAPISAPKQEYYRFNMRFPIEFKNYLQEMAWRNRTDITGYLNNLVAEDMKKHPNWRDTLDILNK